MLLALALATPSFSTPSIAAEGATAPRTLQPEEEDYSPSPYTAYGEFNQDEDEAEELRFYQHGRLFGFGFGLGLSGATGERGRLYEGGFPSLNVRTQYWFGFDLAIQLELLTMKHSYTVAPAKGGTFAMNMAMLGVQFKYYLDVKNLTAALTFANPNLNLGVGSYTKSDVPSETDTPEKETSFGLNFGLGLEFPVINKKTYFTFDSRFHIVTFKDSNSVDFEDPESGEFSKLPGWFYTIQFGLLFVW